MFHHLAHLQKILVKEGDEVKRGDIIGAVGNTGTTYSHIHYEVHKKKPARWTQYTRWMTYQQVIDQYADPNDWIDKIEMVPGRYETYGGYEFLDIINWMGQLHPGVDINHGWGNDDLGSPVKSPCDGKIVYIGVLEGGWGNHTYIEEKPQIDPVFAASQAGKMFLQVEDKGQAWYVTPEGVRVFMGSTPTEMLEFVKKNAIGITNNDLNKIPI